MVRVNEKCPYVTVSDGPGVESRVVGKELVTMGAV